MSTILLEEIFDENGKYLGKVIVGVDDLTPEFIAELKADKDDKKGWKKYRKLMKEKGYDID